MALAQGTRIGVYEIVSPLGAGGMGEVYRAHDTRLGRDVAIKCLPEAFVTDADRLMRFEREARTLAVLNHPHIAQVYGIEESAGTRALVMELIDGDDLAARIARGPIDVDEALAVARQIVDALEAAHNAGIVHRDLKPANVKVRDDGAVKVLDFGLAKAVDAGKSGGSGRSGGDQVLNSPTITSPAMTAAGIILGTAGYMSPEQAKGRAVDKRADVWAFGCVLYEMLTGSAPFAGGESVTEVLAAVLTRDPDWTRLPSSVTPPLRRVLERCLQKEPARRPGSLRDLWLTFEEEQGAWGAKGASGALSADGAGALGASDASRGSATDGLGRRRFALLLAFAGVAAVAGAIGVLATKPRNSEPPARRAMHLAIPLPPGLALLIPAGGVPIAVSPQSDRVAFVGVGEDSRARLFIHELGSGATWTVETASEPLAPAFSPDGATLAFVASSEIFTVRMDRSKPVSLGAAPTAFASTVAWLDGRTLLIGDPLSGPIREFSIETRQIRERTTLQKGESGHTWPFPVGQAGLLYSAWPDRRVWFQRKEGSRIPVLDRAVNAQLIGDDVIVFTREASVWAASFDAATGTVSEPAPVLSEVGVNTIGTPQMVVSSDGMLVHAPASHAGGTVAFWVDRQGKEEPLNLPPGLYVNPIIAPDGLRAAIGMWGSFAGQPDALWLVQHGGSSRTLISRAGIYAAWSPKGDSIFVSSPLGAIVEARADGAGELRQVRTGSPTSGPIVNGVSPDGHALIVAGTIDPTHAGTIRVGELPAKGGELKVLFTEEGLQASGQLSPDGKFLAYVSTQAGVPEIYVRPYPDVNRGRWKASSAIGTEPRWTRGGRELLYWAAGTLMSAAVTATSDTIVVAPAVPILTRRYNSVSPTVVRYDVTPDGNRFLIVNLPTAGPTTLSLVLNWDVEVREKLRGNRTSAP